MEQRDSRVRHNVREFFAGVGLLGRGFRMWLTAPRLMFMGALPALIVATVYLAGIIVFASNLDAISVWATPFATDWEEPFRSLTRVTAVVALLGVTVLVLVYTFTAITLTVGDPFYERIWRDVERRLGGIPNEVETGFWRSLRRGIGEAIRIFVPTALVGLILFFCGFIPIVGQTVVPVLGALVGGWFLVLELTGFPFTARGKSLRERRRVLRGRRARSLGFGVATYLLFFVPLGAIVVMPAAVAGATLLGRNALGESIDVVPRAPTGVPVAEEAGG